MPLRSSATWLPVALLATVLALLLRDRVARRTTMYTITTQRVVIRFGIALPMAVNLPFRLAGRRRARAGRTARGDMPLQLRHGQRVGYVVMWPHVRPMASGQPAADAARVAHVPRSASSLVAAMQGEARTRLVAPAAAEHRSRRARRHWHERGGDR